MPYVVSVHELLAQISRNMKYTNVTGRMCLYNDSKFGSRGGGRLL